MKTPTALALLLFLGCVGQIFAADTLGDAAKREQDRRKKIEARGGPSRVLSENDVPAADRKPRETSSPVASPPVATAAPAVVIPAIETRDEPTAAPIPLAEPTAVPQPVARDAREPVWRRRAASARAAVESAQWECDSAGKHPAVAAARQKQADAKIRLDAARRALAALQDEAQRSGIPAGWLR